MPLSTCEGGRWVPPQHIEGRRREEGHHEIHSETSVEWLSIPELARMLG